MSFGGKEPISQKPEISTQTPKSNTTVPSVTAQTPISQPVIQTQKPNLPPTHTPQTPAAKSETETQQKQTVPEYQSIQIAEKHNIEVALMLAIIYAESNFNPIAVSKNGAGGLMQMMPGTARELGLKVPQYQDKRKPNLNSNIDERFNPYKNLNAGLIYFKGLVEKYKGNLTLALGAYNVGPGKVKVAGPLSSRGEKYADRVLSRYQLYRDNIGQLETDLKRLEALLN
ncbi:hypothetical protein C6499_03365 [Candidatus Poribacteria bacterium]|nr:MAG: hypothetical protein C6499_03365 [Candidatus Poribacteria bacterium]